MDLTRPTHVVWIACTEPARVHEAMRAALGLGLRDAHVVVVATPDPAWPVDAQRALEVLRALGHVCLAPAEAAPALARAHAVEVWT